MTANEILTLPDVILVTLVATAGTVLITLIQIIALWLTKPEAGKETPSPSVFWLSVQIIFGIAVLAGLIWWAFHLYTLNLPKWAGLSGAFALLGIIMPIVAWCAFKKRTKTSESFIATREILKETLPTSKQQSEADISPLPGKRTEPGPEPGPIAEPVIKTKPVAQTAIAAETFADKPIQLEINNPKIPQDSALRRHYLTQGHYLIESGLPVRPTDSALKRHYEHLMNTEMEKFMLGQLDPFTSKAKTIPITEPAVKKAAIDATCPEAEKQVEPSEPGIRAQIAAHLPVRPTDFMLLRHYEHLLATELEKSLHRQPSVSAEISLDSVTVNTAENRPVEQNKISMPQDPAPKQYSLSNLRVQIESALPPRPTDSVLLRHYYQRVEAELAKRLEQLNPNDQAFSH